MQDSRAPGLREVRRACAIIRPQILTAERADLRQASVCITICGERDPHILLVERAATLRSHAGQWGLPGGRRDAGETREQTACRELEEELGIPQADMWVEGRLDDFQTRSGYVISPVVVSCPADVVPRPSPDEIAGCFSIRLSDLVATERFVWFDVAETGRPSVKMHTNGAFLYAPAAAILLQFRALLLGSLIRVQHVEQPLFAWK